VSFRLWLSKASKERNGQVPSGTSPTHGVPPLASVGSSAIAGDQQFWQRLASSSAAPREMKKGGIPTFLSCGGITVLTSTKKKVRRVLARKSLPRTNQNSKCKTRCFRFISHMGIFQYRGRNTFGTCFGETGLKIWPDVFRCHNNCEQSFEALYVSTIFSFSHKKEKGSKEGGRR